MLYKEETIFFYYVNNDIFMGLEPGAIDRAIKDIEREGLYIEDKGNIEDYLSVNIKDQHNVNIKLTQPEIIDRIINDVQIPKNNAP